MEANARFEEEEVVIMGVTQDYTTTSLAPLSARTASTHKKLAFRACTSLLILL